METHCGSTEQWAAWCAADAAERAAGRPAAWKAAAAPPGADGAGLYRMRTYTEQQWRALLAQDAASISAEATHVNAGSGNTGHHGIHGAPDGPPATAMAVEPVDAHPAADATSTASAAGPDMEPTDEETAIWQAMREGMAVMRTGSTALAAAAKAAARPAPPAWPCHDEASVARSDPPVWAIAPIAVKAAPQVLGTLMLHELAAKFNSSQPFTTEN